MAAESPIVISSQSEDSSDLLLYELRRRRDAQSLLSFLALQRTALTTERLVASVAGIYTIPYNHNQLQFK